MKLTPIRTRAMTPPQDDLYSVIKQSVKSIPERSVLAVTSKVVAIHQGRCVRAESIDRETLAKKESDLYIDRDLVPGQHLMFTIKDNILIASAGIDGSNANGHWVLWPENSTGFARELHKFLKTTYGVKEVGVVITDSRVMMLRRGTLGISLGHFGFAPVSSYIGKPDIFGKPLQVSVSNKADALAVAAVMVMGEGKEQTPLALIEEADLKFSEVEKVNQGEPVFVVPTNEDLFSPMIMAVPWQKGGGGKA